MSENVIVNQDKGIMLLPNAGAVVSFQGYTRGTALNGNSDDASAKTKVKFDKEVNSNTPPISRWGESNDWPQEADKIVQSNDILSRLMKDRVAIHYGKGLTYYKEVIKEGKRDIELLSLPEVDDFLEENEINTRYLPDCIGDYEQYNLIYPELILNKAGTKVNRIFNQKTASVRWEQQNPKSRLVENIYLSHLWGSGNMPTEEEYKKIAVMDPYYAMQWIESSKAKNFIYPTSLPSRTNQYYPVPCWYSAVTAGWVDISNGVPKIKNAIYKNQMVLKYHVQVPYSYWPVKYKDWETKKEADRLAIYDAEGEELNKFLTDKENSGKAFFSAYGYDPLTQKEYPGWKIEAIDDKLKDGAFIPDSQEAASHILFAGGMDPSVVGVAMPGGDLGAGSGSDKREAFWIHQAKLYIDRAITLAPFYFIKRFNKWPKELKFGFIDVDTSQTLDKNPQGKQNTVS